MILRRITLISPHPLAEMQRRLRRQTRLPLRASQLLRGVDDRAAASDAVYEGEIDAHCFRLRRRMNNGSSFRPRIVGTFSSDGDGSRIDAVIRLHPLAASTATFFLGLYIFVIATKLVQQAAPVAIIHSTVCFLIFGLTFLIVRQELSFAERTLRVLIDAVPATDPQPPGLS